MNLTDNDYERLKPHFLAIERTSRTSRQSDTSPWYVMAEIKSMRTGLSSDGHCPACVIELYHEFQNALIQYENGKQIEGQRYTDFMREGVK